MKKYIFVKQDDFHDCGVSCLLMIIRTYKGGCSKEFLRDLTKTTTEGTSAYNLLKAGEYFNFNCHGINSSIEDLNINDVPLIAHVIINNSYKHFVVIYKINKDNKTLIIADPADNRIKSITFSEFKKISSKNYLILKPQNKLLKIKENKNLNNLIRSNILKNRKPIFKLLVISLLFAFFSVLSSYSFQIILDVILKYNNYNTVVLATIIFTFLSLLKNIINYFKYKLLVYFNYSLDYDLFTFIYNKLLSLSYIYLKNRTSGEILSRINDLESVKLSFNKAIVSLFIDIFLIIIPIIFLFSINKYLTFILLFIILIYIILFIIIKSIYKNYIYRIKEENSKINSYLIESINSLESIRNLNISNYMNNKFKNNYKKYIDECSKYNIFLNKKDFFESSINSIFDIILLSFGSMLIINKIINPSNLITFYLLTSMTISSLNNIFEFLYEFINTMSSLNRIKELCNMENENLKINLYNNNFKVNDIELRNLSYSYNNRDYILKNINMKIESGKKVLISGRSGKGKSTLMKILKGYLDDYEGQVIINNKELKYISKLNLKENITYISQNEYLYQLSIKNNINIGRDISDEKLKEIYRITKVDDILKKNNIDDNFLLEENAFNISGGEKQRIVLARSILIESDVYILDETLSSVDIRLEREILKELFKYFNDKTIIVISHRFNNKDLFDFEIKL